MSCWLASRQPCRPLAEDTFLALHAEPCCSSNELVDVLAGRTTKVKKWQHIMGLVLAAGLSFDVQIA